MHLSQPTDLSLAPCHACGRCAAVVTAHPDEDDGTALWSATCPCGATREAGPHHPGLRFMLRRAPLALCPTHQPAATPARPVAEDERFLRAALYALGLTGDDLIKLASGGHTLALAPVSPERSGLDV